MNLISMYWQYNFFLHRYPIISYHIDICVNSLKNIITRWHNYEMWLDVCEKKITLSMYRN